MLENVSLDQLRVFIAAADVGSFSGAGRQIRRSQSMVSEAVAGLEADFGVPLFDRTGRYPKLTSAGIVLLADARAVISGINAMKARAKGMAGGLEAELTAVIDVFLPMSVVSAVAAQFREAFPATPLRIYVEALGAALQPVLDRRASFGIVGPLPTISSDLVAERLTNIEFVIVAAATHPLAAFDSLIPKEELSKHVQLVLADRSELSAGREFGVMSPLTWRLADLFAKHAFLVHGLGWGGMPLHIVQADLDAGRLVKLAVEDMSSSGLPLPLLAVFRAAEPPGPAGRWMIDHIGATLSTCQFTSSTLHG